MLWQCQEVIENSYQVARALADGVDLHLVVHDIYGKGLIKKAKTSPDAYIQLALQLAYYRVRHQRWSMQLFGGRRSCLVVYVAVCWLMELLD